MTPLGRADARTPATWATAYDNMRIIAGETLARRITWPQLNAANRAVIELFDAVAKQEKR